MNSTTKKECILELIRLTKLQTKALEMGDVELFIDILEQRKDILDIVEGIPQHLVLLPPEEEKEERDMIRELMELDNVNKSKLGSSMEEVKEELRRIRQHKKTSDNYNKHYDISQEEGMFFDKRERR